MGYDSDHHHQQHRHPPSSPPCFHSSHFTSKCQRRPSRNFRSWPTAWNRFIGKPRARDTWDEDSSSDKRYKLVWWTFRLLIFLLHRPEFLRGLVSLVHLMQNPNFVQNDPGIVSAESILCDTIHWGSSWVFPSATIIFFSLQNYKQLLAV